MSYRGRAQSDQSTKNLLSTHYVFQQIFNKCLLHAKIFLGAGDTEIKMTQSLSEGSQGGWQYNKYRKGLQEYNILTEYNVDRKDDVRTPQRAYNLSRD